MSLSHVSKIVETTGRGQCVAYIGTVRKNAMKYTTKLFIRYHNVGEIVRRSAH